MKKICLIIEDETSIANAQAMILRDEFIVHHAADGEEGIRKALRLKPAVVILDLMLPKVHGYEVCKRIKEELRETKVVMVTAKNQDRDEQAGMGLGADDYIMKPFEADELLHVVHQVLK